MYEFVVVTHYTNDIPQEVVVHAKDLLFEHGALVFTDMDNHPPHTMFADGEWKTVARREY